MGYRTPASKAGIKNTFKNWADVIGIPNPKITRKIEPLIVYNTPRTSNRFVSITPRLNFPLPRN